MANEQAPPAGPRESMTHNCEETPCPAGAPLHGGQPPTVSYTIAHSVVRKGDTVLCRLRVRWWNPLDWPTVLIALVAYTAGRPRLPLWQRYVHAGKVVACEGRLILAEVTSGGGKMQRLSEVVKRWPKKLVIFRPGFEGYKPARAAQAMVDATGKPYGYVTCFLMGAFHLLLLGRCAKRFAASRARFALPDCSMQVALADLAGGGNPCPGKAAWEIEPHDLGESPAYQALFVLDR